MSSQAPDIGHTPGPWFWNDRDQLVGEEWAEPCYPAEPARRVVIVETDGGHYAPYGADRLLIAAAPELLEALKIAQQFMSIASDWNIDEAEINGQMRSTYDWLDVVNKAIAKATKGSK